MGLRFESGGFVISVVHALGTAAAVTDLASHAAYAIEEFISGVGRFGEVPEALSKFNVTAVMRKNQALELAGWIRSIDRQVFKDEVASMFGSDVVSVFTAASRDLQRAFQSVARYQADICVVGRLV